MSRRLPLVDQTARRADSRSDDAPPALALSGPSLTLRVLDLPTCAFVPALLDALRAGDVAPVLAVAGEAPWLLVAAPLRLPSSSADAREALERARGDAPWRPLMVVGDGASAFRPMLSVLVVPPGRVGALTKGEDLVVAAPGELLARRIAAVFSLVRYSARR